MAWKGAESEEVDVSKLLGVLNNSQLKQNDNPAYQVVSQLLSSAQSFRNTLTDVFKFGGKRKINLKEDVTGLLDDKNGGTRTFYYVPIPTAVANVVNIVPFFCHVTVFNNLVQVYGKLSLDTLAPGVISSIKLNIPIPNSFNTLNPDQLHGLINGIPEGGGVEGFAGIIRNDTTDGKAQLIFYPKTAENYNCRFNFSYIRLPLS